MQFDDTIVSKVSSLSLRDIKVPWVVVLVTKSTQDLAMVSKPWVPSSSSTREGEFKQANGVKEEMLLTKEEDDDPNGDGGIFCSIIS